MTERQYKLLKDLPGLEAGALFTYNKNTGIYESEQAAHGKSYSFLKINNNLYPGWFEEVKANKKWKPRKVDKYWFVDEAGNVGKLKWFNDDIEKRWYKSGSCFRTEEEAEEYKEYKETEHMLRELADDEQEWDGENIHYELYYDTEIKKPSVGGNSFVMGNSFYFASNKSARAALKAIGEERLIKYFTYGKSVV